jgi:GNAT superfamily N-acetyltransferase
VTELGVRALDEANPAGLRAARRASQRRLGRVLVHPRIKRRRAYLEGLDALPYWRITCFFVDSEHRRRGVASTALGGALREIARRGGGTVESYLEGSDGRSVSSSFLHDGTVAMFESHGFERTRRVGKHHWVVEGRAPSGGAHSPLSSTPFARSA